MRHGVKWHDVTRKNCNRICCVNKRARGSFATNPREATEEGGEVLHPRTHCWARRRRRRKREGAGSIPTSGPRSRGLKVGGIVEFVLLKAPLLCAHRFYCRVHRPRHKVLLLLGHVDCSCRHHRLPFHLLQALVSLVYGVMQNCSHNVSYPKKRGKKRKRK